MDNCRSEETNKQLVKRLNRIEGQIRGINRMIDENRDCMDIMHQVLSAGSALRSVWEILAAAHLEDCLSGEKDEKSKKAVIEDIISHMKDLR